MNISTLFQNQGFCIFLGLIAGTVVNIITNKFFEWSAEKQQVKNLKFEFGFNIKKVDSFLDELTNYRNAVNGDSLSDYFGYFNLSRIISVTANNMFSSGLLYKYLTHDEIGKLQIILSEFSPAIETSLNSQISQYKNEFNKQKAIADINFWERKFKDHKNTLKEILERLE